GVTVIDGRGVARQLPVGAATAVAWGDGGRLYVGTETALLVVGAGAPRTLLDQPIAALAQGEGGMYAAGAAGLVPVAPPGTVERRAGAAVNGGAPARAAPPPPQAAPARPPPRAPPPPP